MNLVVLKGNLGNAPELRYTSTGTAVCHFNMATNERWVDKNSGEPKNATEWHRIVVWGKQAEFANDYLGKGSGILVRGKLKTREWTNRDGNKQKSTEVHSQFFEMLTSKKAPATTIEEEEEEELDELFRI